MKTPRIYIDTSVIGGCFDAEFAPWSNGLMQDFRCELFRPVLSEVVAVETHPAPDPVRVQYAELLKLGAEFLAVSDEALDLAAVYEGRGISLHGSAMTCSILPWQRWRMWILW